MRMIDFLMRLLPVAGLILIIGAAGGVDTDVCTVPQCIGFVAVGAGMIIPGVVYCAREAV